MTSKNISSFFLKGREITFSNIDHIHLKLYFDQNAITIELIDDIVFLGFNSLLFKELDLLPHRIQINGKHFASYQRILTEVKMYERFPYRLDGERGSYWTITATLYDANRHSLSNLARTIYYSIHQGEPDHGKISLEINQALRDAGEADLTPELDRWFERWMALDVILKDVPKFLNKEQYREACAIVGCATMTDRKASEFAKCYLLVPVSCDYLPAKKIAEDIVHLRRAATILNDKLRNDNPRNRPIISNDKSPVTCYFCKKPGHIGIPPFMSPLVRTGTTPICDICLHGS